MTPEDIQKIREWKKHATENFHCMSEWQIAVCVLLERWDKAEARIKTLEEALLGVTNWVEAVHAAPSPHGAKRALECIQVGACAVEREARVVLSRGSHPAEKQKIEQKE